jgi:hypothetical protein
MRQLLPFGLLGLILALAGGAGATAGQKVASAGVELTIPAGWRADTNKLLGCDPQRLLLLSSRPIRTARTGGLLRPSSGQVLIEVVEDHMNLPTGDLHRPARFSVDWNRTTQLEGGCGSPHSSASMHWFHADGRYLGLTVYPGSNVPPATRTQTTAVMDSLRVTGRFTLP